MKLRFSLLSALYVGIAVSVAMIMAGLYSIINNNVLSATLTVLEIGVLLFAMLISAEAILRIPDKTKGELLYYIILGAILALIIMSIFSVMNIVSYQRTENIEYMFQFVRSFILMMLALSFLEVFVGYSIKNFDDIDVIWYASTIIAGPLMLLTGIFSLGLIIVASILMLAKTM